MTKDGTDFDDVAVRYEAELQQGLALTGFGKDEFALRRMRYLASLLPRFGMPRVERAVDFGCGTGTSCPLLKELLGARDILGLDVSEESLRIAREACGSGFRFENSTTHQPTGDADLVFSNGVFHHIPPEERAQAVDSIRSMLRPGGVFALWENNPWNPGARYVMSRIPFDRDAVMLSPREAKRLLTRSGFRILAQRSFFFFPKFLRILTPLEPYLAILPLGGQHLTLGQAPDAS